VKGDGKKPSGLLAVIGDLRAPKGNRGIKADDQDDDDEAPESSPAYDEEAAAQRAVDAAKKGDARGFLAAFRELHGAVCECGDEGEDLAHEDRHPGRATHARPQPHAHDQLQRLRGR
jgi:hypothetical protein